jgi:hypothetical protein
LVYLRGVANAGINRPRIIKKGKRLGAGRNRSGLCGN